MKKKFAFTHWTIEDIKERKPKWSNQKCEAWLEKNQNFILDAMVSAGNNLIDDILEGWGD